MSLIGYTQYFRGLGKAALSFLRDDGRLLNCTALLVPESLLDSTASFIFDFVSKEILLVRGLGTDSVSRSVKGVLESAKRRTNGAERLANRQNSVFVARAQLGHGQMTGSGLEICWTRNRSRR